MQNLGAFFGSLHFLAPWALWAFASLPLLWWLLRLTPPSPRRQAFPALMLLRDLAPVAQSPAHTPWWLLLLRLLLLCLLFLGLARPVFAPSAQLPGDGALVLLVDNSWAAAGRWPQWQASLRQLCRQAEREERDIIILPTAPEQRRGHLAFVGPTPALTACPTLARLQPRPWPADHAAARPLLAEKINAQNYVYWFSDGLLGAETAALHETLRRGGNLTLYQEDKPHYLLQPSPQQSGAATAINVTRADTGAAAEILVTALDKAGRSLGIAQGSFKPREKTITVMLDLPSDLRNQASRLQLQDSHDAGGAFLLDSRHARHQAGLIGDAVTQRDQPLLNGLHYLSRALKSRSEVRIATAAELLTGKAGFILNTNERALLPQEAKSLESWVEQGGVLVQFAGTALDTDSPLLPAPLRQNRRDLGGIFSWNKPQALQAFPPASPFKGLAIPTDVSISQQLLADPAGLNGNTSWALLADGTPLVTGARRGRGLTVLFHVPAYPGWSNLPLSGLFMQMLERLADMATTGGAAFDGVATLPPHQLMDAFGQLQPTDAGAQPLTPADQAAYAPSPEHPPGLYGQPPQSRAFNLGQGISSLLPFLPGSRESLTAEAGDHELRPWLLLAALLLFLGDMLLAMALRGLLPQRLTAAALLGALCLPAPLQAATGAEVALSGKIWLGYVTNGADDRRSLAATGLNGLAARVKQKTAVEEIGVLPINLEQDDLSLMPLLYWPLSENPQLSAKAQGKLQDYFAHGGMLLIDLNSDPEHNAVLRESGIPLPMLAPITPEHPLMRTFYLLEDCPGRTLDGAVWSERDTGGRQDNVPALFIGARDWASAWASGAGRTRQQETALRCGLNLVMYALTGNYKMDQVHLPVIMERLHR